MKYKPGEHIISKNGKLRIADDKKHLIKLAHKELEEWKNVYEKAKIEIEKWRDFIRKLERRDDGKKENDSSMYVGR